MSSPTSTGWRKSRKGRPSFFIDRCLGPKFARALEKFDVNVVHLSQIYDHKVEDVVWIRDSARHGYAVFTANPRMLMVDYEMEAIREHGARLFCMANASQTGDLHAMITGRHLLPILRRAVKPEPCFWRIHPQGTKHDLP